MIAVQKLLVRFAGDESAAAAIEYLLIVAGLSIVIVAVLQRFGIALNGIFSGGEPPRHCNPQQLFDDLDELELVRAAFAGTTHPRADAQA